MIIIFVCIIIALSNKFESSLSKYIKFKINIFLEQMKASQPTKRNGNQIIVDFMPLSLAASLFGTDMYE